MNIEELMATSHVGDEVISKEKGYDEHVLTVLSVEKGDYIQLRADDDVFYIFASDNAYFLEVYDRATDEMVAGPTLLRVDDIDFRKEEMTC